MNEATKQAAIRCQQWAAHYAEEAEHARQHAKDHDGCKYRARALKCQRLAEINAATARAILAD